MIKCEIRRITGTVTRNIYSDFAELKANLREADLWRANLRGADLRRANLRGANLREANLRGADLREADLREANLWRANLRGADLRRADLRGANLREADLREANLDFSCLTFSCRSLFCKTSEKQRIQLVFHALSWIKIAIQNNDATEEEGMIYQRCIDYANKFHHDDVERLPSL